MESNKRDCLKNLENAIVHSRSKPLENSTAVPSKISRADAITLDFRYDQSFTYCRLPCTSKESLRQ